MRLIEVVACLLPADRGSNYCSLAWAMDGPVVRCDIISSCQSAATSEILKHFWSRADSCNGSVESSTADLYLSFLSRRCVQPSCAYTLRVRSCMRTQWGRAFACERCPHYARLSSLLPPRRAARSRSHCRRLCTALPSVKLRGTSHCWCH